MGSRRSYLAGLAALAGSVSAAGCVGVLPTQAAVLQTVQVVNMHRSPHTVSILVHDSTTEYRSGWFPPAAQQSVTIPPMEGSTAGVEELDFDLESEGSLLVFATLVDVPAAEAEGFRQNPDSETDCLRIFVRDRSETGSGHADLSILQNSCSDVA